jgi:PAS domain S-box-containing protein
LSNRATLELDRFLASSGEGFAALDRQLRYTYVNNAATTLVGLSREAVIGRTPNEILPPEVADDIVPRVREVMATGRSQQYDTYLPALNRWFENRLYPSDDGVFVFFSDITTRREAEEALRRSDESHRFLVSLNDAVRTLRDPHQIMLEISMRVGRHFGATRCTYGEIDDAQQHVVLTGDYTDGAVSVAGRHRLDEFGPALIRDLTAGQTVVVPDVALDARTADPNVIAAFAAIETRSLLCVPLVKEGRFVALFVLHQRQPRGWNAADAALMEQVAERTWFAVEHSRAEAALRESRDVLALAMRSGRMGAWSRNLITNEIWWSRELEEIFGLAPGGFDGTEAGVLAFVHADDRPYIERAVADAIAAGRDYIVEFRFQDASGALRWMEGRGRAIYGADGAPESLHGLGIDITSRKASDAALADALERERLLVRLDDAVRSIADPEQITFTAARLLGAHLGVNRCAYATVEADEDSFDLTGNYTNGVGSIVGRYRFAQFGAECLRRMRAGEPYVVNDSYTDAQIDDGDREAYERTEIRAVICVPILKAGRFVAAMAVHTKSPRAWRTAEVELVQQFASRCWESIERARVEGERAGLLEAAEAANRAKDEFMAMLGHELRNPLSPIVTALQLMKLRGGVASDRERTVIERQVAHLTRLVDDLLDVSRIARGKVELKAEIVELSQVVASAIEVASPLLEQRQHTLTVDVPRQDLAVEGDVARLSQIVSNLLTNAAKYTPPGGRITVTGAAEGGEVVLRVRDTGIGIPPEVLPRVFDLFVQGRQSLDRAEGGLGLGLTIVRSLVDRHHGSVTVSSDGPGCGSEFTVRLPRTAHVSGAVPGGIANDDAAPEAAGRGGARILIVDDNDDAAVMLSHALGAKGYETQLAHDGFQALQIAATRRPDAALLDIGLPVMDGYELAGRLREIDGLADLPLVAVTGYGQESDRRRSAAAGFHHHVVKPIDLDTLFDLLALVLTRSRRHVAPSR